MSRATILSMAKEVKSVSSKKEAAKLLSGGNWIAVYAAQEGKIGFFRRPKTVFVLARIC